MIKRYILITAVICLVVIILISGILLSWVHRIEASLAADDTLPDPSEPAPVEEWTVWTNGVLSVSYPESRGRRVRHGIPDCSDGKRQRTAADGLSAAGGICRERTLAVHSGYRCP